MAALMAPHTARTEAEVRIDLAAAYRLAALAGWDDTIYTHLSAAVPGEPGVYLINEFGLGFDEVRASDLVKVDTDGRVVDGTDRRVNPSGFAIHGAIHAARPDVECVVHLHAPWGVALSMLPHGLLPTSQWAMRLHGRLGRHRYEGPCARRARSVSGCVRALGPLDGLILENHGTLDRGPQRRRGLPADAHPRACGRAQLRAMAAAGGRLEPAADALAELTHRQWVGDGSERDGDAEWPALLRRADRLSPGFRA